MSKPPPSVRPRRGAPVSFAHIVSLMVVVALASTPAANSASTSATTLADGSSALV